MKPQSQVNRRSFVKGAALTASAVAASQFAPLPSFAKADELALLDGLGQAELIRKRQISALELTRATVARIEASEPFINALVTETFDAAIKRARSGGLGRGPFAGVPYLIKELQEYPGLPQTLGSRHFANNMGRVEFPYIRRTRQAGFNVLGTSASPEFGLLATTESLLNGPTRNPWNRGHSAGGSSGGAGAAVAAGMVPLAHASDGGGSIRIPASCCGVFGLKPSRDRNLASRKGGRAVDISVGHCVSRSVRDSAMLLSLTEAKGRAARLEPVGFVSEPDAKRLRIAVSARNVFQDRPHKEVRRAVEDAADLCEDLGHDVDDEMFEVDGEEFTEHFLILWASGPAKTVADYRKRYGKMPDDSVFESWTLGLAEHFNSKPGDALEQAVQYFKGVERGVDQFLQKYDVALTPTLFTPPPPLGEQGPVAPFGELYDRVVDYVSYTPQHNVAGTPAMSVPLHWTKDGLPVGSQFAARYGQEAVLLSLAYELEMAKPWADKWPAICAHTEFAKV